MDGRGDTWLIYNGSSGNHDEEMLAGIKNGLAAAGHRPARVIDCKDGTPDAREADAAGAQLIVIHGGDGTLSRSIARLEGFGGAVLALPGGTFNLFAREMFGDRDPLAIVGLLREGRLAAMRRTCIRGAGVLAVAEILAGPGAKWADVREELRDANIGEVLAKGWDAVATSAVGPMVALSEPARGRDGGYAGIRLSPRKESIAIEGYGAEGLGEFVQQGIAILRRDFREGPHDGLGSPRKAVCRSLQGQPIPLMVDGERSEGAAVLTFSLDTLDVDLLGMTE